MTVAIGTGKPTATGIYACRQRYGWRILQWHKGEWWHVGCAAKWPSRSKGCEIERWCGPLPFTPVERQSNKIKLEYDL